MLGDSCYRLLRVGFFSPLLSIALQSLKWMGRKKGKSVCLRLDAFSIPALYLQEVCHLSLPRWENQPSSSDPHISRCEQHTDHPKKAFHTRTVLQESTGNTRVGIWELRSNSGQSQHGSGWMQGKSQLKTYQPQETDVPCRHEDEPQALLERTFTRLHLIYTILQSFLWARSFPCLIVRLRSWSWQGLGG